MVAQLMGQSLLIVVRIATIRVFPAAHTNQSGNLNFVLPSSHGTNGQFMKTDGSGNLSFVDAPSAGKILQANLRYFY